MFSAISSVSHVRAKASSILHFPNKGTVPDSQAALHLKSANRHRRADGAADYSTSPLVFVHKGHDTQVACAEELG